jgi:hypothetical protein
MLFDPQLHDGPYEGTHFFGWNIQYNPCHSVDLDVVLNNYFSRTDHVQLKFWINPSRGRQVVDNL